MSLMYCTVWLEEVHHGKWWSSHRMFSRRTRHADWHIVCVRFVQTDPLGITSNSVRTSWLSSALLNWLQLRIKTMWREMLKNEDDKLHHSKKLRSAMRERDPCGAISVLSRGSQRSSEYNYGSKQWCIRQEIKQNTTLQIGGSGRGKAPLSYTYLTGHGHYCWAWAGRSWEGGKEKGGEHGGRQEGGENRREA